MANTVINTPELLNLDSTTGATVLAKGTVNERPPVQTFSVEYLAVAGGGGGGYQDAGGGGAGGFLTNTLSSINNGQSFTLTIGEGGAGGTKNPAVVNSGDNTVIAYGSTTITAIGGGGGSSDNNVVVAASGGSGGGGAGGSGTNTGGAGTTGQGNAGGNGASNNQGGGGGGAGAAGQNATSSGANGGIGLTTTIISTTNATTASVGEVSGSNLYFAGGGGGDNRTVFGSGGLGGGTNAAANPIDAAANTGGGGGSAYNGSPVRGGAGGSGVIILKYGSSVTLTKGSGLTEASGSPFTEGSYKVSVFTQGTGNVTLSTTPDTLDAIDGTLRFNTDTNKTEYFDGANWYEIVDEYASGFVGPATNYFDTKLYTGNNATQIIGGHINGAASFNGSSSQIILPENSTVIPNNNFTYSLWFNSSSTAFQTLFSHLGSSTPKYGLFLNHSSDSSQSIRFFYSLGSNSQGNVSSSASVWAVDTWYNIVITKSSTNGLKGYLNNVEILSDTTLTADLTPYTLQDGNSNLGAYQYQNSGGLLYYFAGFMDQVRIYNAVLSSSDITALYGETSATASTAAFPSGQTASVTYTMDTSANGLLNTQDLSTVDYPAGTGCIALYEMNGNSNDTSGTYNGTDVSLIFQGGAFDQAASFDGSNSKITLSSTISGIKTYSFWINPNSSGNATYARRLFGDVGGTSYSNSITFDKPNSKVIYYEGTSARSSDTISNDTWSHIAFTSDGSTLKVYTNGSLSNTYTTSGFVSSINEICSTASNRQFNGLIDQVRIFDTALSASDITTLARGVATSYGGTTTNVNFNGHLDFAPDLVWIKVRSAAGYNHNLFDTIRGATYRLMSNNANAQDSNGHLTAFNNNGFTLDAGGDANPSQEMISWNWKAGGAAVTNNDGTVASQVSANKDSGFSIVKYTGSGSAMSVGHGLSSVPELVFFKSTNASANWLVLTDSIDGSADYLTLNSTAAKTDLASGWLPDSTKLNFASSSSVINNTNGTQQMIAYCFHSVNNFSKINFYTGTGSSGNSIVTGFQPSFLMVKRTDSTSNWRVYNSAMGTGLELYANTDAAEASATGYLNFNSTGFEITTTGGWLNANGGTYLYMAIA